MNRTASKTAILACALTPEERQLHLASAWEQWIFPRNDAHSAADRVAHFSRQSFRSSKSIADFVKWRHSEALADFLIFCNSRGSSGSWIVLRSYFCLTEETQKSSTVITSLLSKKKSFSNNCWMHPFTIHLIREICLSYPLSSVHVEAATPAFTHDVVQSEDYVHDWLRALPIHPLICTVSADLHQLSGLSRSVLEGVLV